MRFVIAGMIGRAQRLHELLAVVREFVNRMSLIVHDPDVLVGVVGIFSDVVRAAEHGIPFRPVFDDVAVRIHDNDAVFPARVDAELAAPHWIAGACYRPDRCITKRKLRNRERDAGADLRIWNFVGPFHGGNFPALEYENSVRRLRKNLSTAPQVHFSWPGSVVMGLGQSGATS